MPPTSRSLTMATTLCLLAGPCFADNTTPIEPLASPQGTLSGWKLDEFLIRYHDQYGEAAKKAKLTPDGDTVIPLTVKRDLAQPYRGELAIAVGDKDEYTIAEIRSIYPAKPTKEEVQAKLPAWKKIPYITKAGEQKWEDGEAKYQAKEGPIHLRREAGDLKELKDAKGAKIGFSDNRLQEGNGAWNTEGALIFPLRWKREGADASSLSVHLTPAVSWNFVEQEAPGKSDVDELKLSAPIIMGHTPGGRLDPQEYIAIVEPYYQTDWDFDGEILGGSLKLEYVGKVGPVHFGSFHSLFDASEAKSIDDILAYRLRIKPMLDYSEVVKKGGFDRAEDDDWLRLGGEVSFELRFFGSDNPLDLGITYRFAEEVHGDGGFSDLFKANATLWLSPNAGLTLEYQKGETPVADKDIDLITLGLELKL